MVSDDFEAFYYQQVVQLAGKGIPSVAIDLNVRNVVQQLSEDLIAVLSPLSLEQDKTAMPFKVGIR